MSQRLHSYQRDAIHLQCTCLAVPEDFMENFEQQWLDTENALRERFGKLPDMEGILFLIGVNELGKIPRRKFSKEQKQDIMHIAVCTLLCQLGYYEYVGRDEEGWPHFNELEKVPVRGLMEQERMLKECVINYFEQGQS